MKNERSTALFERARRIAPGGVHSPVRAFKGVGGVPVFVTSANGCRLHDVDGNEYLDFCMSWGPLILGHRDLEVTEAVRGAIDRGWSYGTAEPYSLELAELITSRLPWVQKIRFVNSGTEAVMSALRVARAATGRNKILKFDGCYHGHTDSMLVRAGSGLAEMASPDSAGVSSNVAGETLVAPLDDLEAVKAVFSEHGAEIAAVIIEPVPANNGLLLQKDGYLKSLCEIARASGALVIFDEVITGFRVAFGGMAEKTGLRPDLVTYGKIIGGGFPVGAYGGRADLMDLVAPAGPVYQAGTLSANPVAMSAGLATLKKLLRENPYSTLANACERVAHSFERTVSGLMPVTVQHYESLFWPALGKTGAVRSLKDIPTEQKSSYARIFHSLLAEGVYFAPSGYEVGLLSMAHGGRDIEFLDEALHTAVARLKEGAGEG
jgi:glutamate-1-semialdehyde 2,1-aminomutase